LSKSKDAVTNLLVLLCLLNRTLRQLLMPIVTIVAFFRGCTGKNGLVRRWKCNICHKIWDIIENTSTKFLECDRLDIKPELCNWFSHPLIDLIGSHCM